TTMNETGTALMKCGYPDLGSFVVEALRDGEKALLKDGPGADTELVLERVSMLFICFYSLPHVFIVRSSDPSLSRYVYCKLSTCVPLRSAYEMFCMIVTQSHSNLLF